MTRRARLARLLAQAPPRPQPDWCYYVETNMILHAGRKIWVEVRGLRLRVLGASEWSEDYNVYRVFMTRELMRRSRLDPVGMLVELAAQIGVPVYDMKLELRDLNWPRSPDGLCQCCWRNGRREPGRAYLHNGSRPGGSPLVRSMCLCDSHRTDVDGLTLLEFR